jgi:hypothetical protein
LGIQQDKHLRRTVVLSSREKGIVGVMKAFYHVNEVQGGKQLHLHGVGFTDMTANLMQDAASYPHFVSILTKVIDSMVIAELPILSHA